MLSRFKFVFLAVLAIGALAAVACGGNGDDSGNGEPPQRETEDGGDSASDASFSDEEFVSGGALVLTKSVRVVHGGRDHIDDAATSPSTSRSGRLPFRVRRTLRSRTTRCTWR